MILFQHERTEAGAGLAAFWGKGRTFPGSLLNPAVLAAVVLVRKVNQLGLLEDTEALRASLTMGGDRGAFDG
ncbi:hypothetical protein [Acidovorax sp. LjRoot66]|uniref:hypothetical protein n=1 Tax=Acidovorax sp. LjRoot66 TaxID=3342334 RepID=UPI003F50B61C